MKCGTSKRPVPKDPVVGDLIVTKTFMPPNYLQNIYGWVLSVDYAKGAATIVLCSPTEAPIRNVPFNLFVIGERPSLAAQEAAEYSEAIRRSLEDADGTATEGLHP